jgi:hypothetical protein
LARRLCELEKEALDLRRRLETQVEWTGQVPPTPTVSSIESGLAAVTPVMSHSSTSPEMHMATMVSPPAEDVEVKLIPSANGTLPRNLDGVAVSATVLDELFAM